MITAKKGVLLNALKEIFRTPLAAFGYAPLVGLFLGGLLVYVPLQYIAVGVGVVAFAYLLFSRIEVAVIFFLLIHNQLGRFNYLGEGTPFHPNGLVGAAIIGGALYYFLLHFNKIDFSRFRAWGGFLGFFLICSLSLARSGTHLMDSLNVTLRLATALAIYLVLLYNLDSINKAKWVIGVIIAAQVLPTITGLLMVSGKTGLVFTEETARLGNSGVGVYLAMILTLCVAFVLNADTNSKRLLLWSLTLLYTAGLFYSFGRAGWIGFMVALIVIGLLRHRKLLVILPAILALALILVPAIRQRFSDISLDNLSDRRSSTLAHRLDYWQAAAEITKSAPVFGVGYGVGRYRVGEHRAQYASMIHNDYFSVLLETGLIGFVFFMVWHGQWLRAIFKVFQQSEHRYDKMLALGAFAVFLASLVMRITDNLLLDSYKLYPLCALIAATLALPRLRAEEETSSGGPGLSNGCSLGMAE